MRRLPSAAFWVIAALFLAIVLFYPVVRQVPAVVTAAEHGGTVELHVDDVTVLTATDCVTVQWHVERIAAVELDGKGVTGEGTRLSCDSSVDLEVTFQDGENRTYSVPKQSQTDSLLNRLLMVVALFAFGLGIIFSGLLSALPARWRESVFAHNLSARLASTTPSDFAAGQWVLPTMIAILLTGAAVRTHFLSRSLRWDETRTYLDFASQPPLGIIQDYQVPNNHIFHSLLVHLSTTLFGVSPWTLRLPVYFSGILLIAATLMFARRFYGVRVGLLAAALMAGASWMIEFSANARGYNIVALCTLFMFVLAYSLRRRRSRQKWLAFALLGTLGLFTIPTMAYPLGLICLWLGMSIISENHGSSRRVLLRDLLLAVLLMLVLAGLLYLPAYFYLRSGANPDADFRNFSPVSWQDFSDALQLELSKVWAAWQRDLAGWMSGLLVIGVAVSVIFHRLLARFRLNLLLVAVLWLPPMVFVQMALTYDRVWTFLHPLYLTLASAGLIFLWSLFAPARWRSRTGAVAGVSVLIALASAGGDIHSNMVDLTLSERALGVEAAVEYLNSNRPAGSTLYCFHQCPVVRFYGLKYGLRFDGDYRKTVADGPILVVATLPDAPVTAKEAVRFIDIPSHQYQTPQEVFSEGDTKVFRLDPVTTTDGSYK